MKFKYRRKIVAFKNKPWVDFLIRYLKDFYDKTVQTNSQLKFQFLQFFPFFVASLLTGFMAFVYSELFSFAEEISLFVYHQHRAFVFLTTPLTFLLSWWIVHRYAPYAKGSGIPQVMAAIELTKPSKNHLISHFLSLKIILAKVASSVIKVMGGGVLGREGPTIQVSSAIFNQVYKLLPEWWIPISQKNILIAGAAAGLAAAFNTPLGGIIFAIEELSKFHIKYHKNPLFVTIIIAGLTAQGFTGPYIYLGQPTINITSYLTYGGVIVVAIVTGYFGAKMCNVLLKFMRFMQAQSSRRRQMGIVVLSALFVAVTIYFLGTDTMGSGKTLMVRTLFTNEKTVEWYLPFVRMNSMIASFGFGGAGGVFAPSLSSGASFGALIAELLQLTGSNADVLILIGMAGFLTAVTRTPFTSSIIIFEMTDRHSIIFLLLLGTFIANMVAYSIEKHSFYDILKESYLKDVEASGPLEIEEKKLP